MPPAGRPNRLPNGHARLIPLERRVNDGSGYTGAVAARWVGTGGSLLVAMGLLACGGSAGGGDDSGGAGGGGAQSGSGGSGAAGSGSGGGDCSAPNCAGCEDCWHEKLCQGLEHDAAVDACIDNPEGLEVVAITTDAFVVGAGEETYRCQSFSNPFGKDVEIQRTESYMTPGSHHMFAFYAPGASDGAVTECSGLEFDRSLHTSQRPYNQFAYPPGVAARLLAGEGIRINAHYLNTSSSELTAKVTTVLYLAKPGSVQHFSSHIFYNNLAIFVPPSSPGTAQKTCTLPKDIQLFAVTSHMHQYGKHFVAKTGSGADVFETFTWDDPEFRIFDPPLAIAGGESVTFSCEYENPTSSPLTFGESAKTNEMCILSGRYFPATDGETIECF